MTSAVDDAPPLNIEAEGSVLGAMLVSGKALKLVLTDTGLVAGHFYLDRHREIFEAIKRVSQEAGVADQLMVADALPVHRDQIAELAAKVPAAGNAKHYASIVLSAASRRAKREGAQRIMEGVNELDPVRAEELYAQGLQLAASDLTVEAEPTSKEELRSEFYDRLMQEDEAEEFRLPWEPLNRLVILRRGQVSVFAGWTNMGKSVVLDNSIAAFDKQGHKCAIFATEMSREERTARWVQTVTGIPAEKSLLRKGLKADDYPQILKALELLPFDYFEADGWSAEKIAERIIFGGYDVVAVDPINLIPDFEKTETASRAARRFTEVARRAGCHLILVSHLHRGRAKNVSGVLPKPRKSDLRDTGMLETNAHQILFLHRDQDADANVLPFGDLYFDKVRFGMLGGVRVEFVPRYLAFQLSEAAREAEVDRLNGEQTELDTGNENQHDRQALPF